jgi:plasmid maintenance system killer protein
LAIKSWKSKQTQAVFDGESPGIVPKKVLKRANAKLLMLHAATALKDLTSPPGNRLEKLKGDRVGQHSTASGSTISTVSASSGETATPMTWRLRTITEQTQRAEMSLHRRPI